MVLVMEGTGRRWGGVGGRFRSAGRDGFGLGNGGERVRSALPGQHLFKHLPAYFAPFLFAGRFGHEALLLALEWGLLHP
jgi:hypothetical protein